MSAPTPESFDVVVAGAGLTGSTLALALARAGLSVALVDPAPPQALFAGAPDGRASAVSPTSLAQWRALGLEAEVLAGAEPIRAIEIADARPPGAARQAHLLSLLQFGPPDADPGPLGWMVPNADLRAALGRALRAADVRILAGERILASTPGPRTAETVLAGGGRLAGRLLVAAEGRRSPLRDQAGVRTLGWSYPQCGLVANVALDRPHGGVARQIFLPGGPLAVLPLPRGEASLVWSAPRAEAEALAAASPAAFEAHLARRFGEALGRPRLTSARSLFPLALQLAERLTAARLALVGDAAHAVHPIAGQGLNLGLRDVAALAEVAADAVRVGEDPGSDLVLDRYARWRRLDGVLLALVTDGLNRLFSADAAPLRRLRSLGLGAVARTPGLQAAFMREASGAAGELPRLLRGEPL